MNTPQQYNTAIAYIGLPGAGFGFQLSGLEVREVSNRAETLPLLRELIKTNRYGIIFIDENLAEPHQDIIDTLNEQPLPAIMLLPNPAEPKHIAASRLQVLMVRAVGSDIFS